MKYITKKEIYDISISVAAITFALMFAVAGMSLFSDLTEMLILFFIVLVTVGSGFILHEMGHKIVAMYYGAYAQFKMWVKGLIIMLFISIFGVVFAAPGAVYIYSKDITKREYGIISLAGPFVNIVLVIVFFILSKCCPIYFIPHDINFDIMAYIGNNIWSLGVWINYILAVFNAIPAYPLDGSKVLDWGLKYWAGFVFVVTVLGYLVFSPEFMTAIVLFMLGLFVIIKLFSGMFLKRRISG